MKLSEFEPTKEVFERASKCTTPDELTALAREYDVELTAEEISELLKSNSLKELNDAQLDQVSGGETHAERTAKYLPKDHGKFIEHYTEELYFGQKVYVVADADREIFVWGTLLRSFEDDVMFGATKRTHEVLIEGVNDYWRVKGDYNVGETDTFNSDNYSLYLMH